jgi:hypothetical protein
LKPAPPRTAIGFRHLIANRAEKLHCAVHHWQLDPQLPTTVRGGAESLKGFHSMGVNRKDENLCASPFKEGPLNDTTFSQIHVDGHTVKHVNVNDL